LLGGQEEADFFFTIYLEDKSSEILISDYRSKVNAPFRICGRFQIEDYKIDNDAIQIP